MAGKPSDPLHSARAKLRDTNTQLRKAQRQELAVRRDRDLGKVMSARSHDRNLMYRLIKRHKLSSKEETDILEVNGTTYTGPDQVRLGWLEHYRSLAQPSLDLDKTSYDNRIALATIFSAISVTLLITPGFLFHPMMWSKLCNHLTQGDLLMRMDSQPNTSAMQVRRSTIYSPPFWTRLEPHNKFHHY